MVLSENSLEREAPAHPGISVDEIEIGGLTLRILESCHSLWIFEPARSRFRRVPQGTRLDPPWPDSDWTVYYRLEVEPSTGAFAVYLNEDDTRVMRSWLHTESCRHCSGPSDHTGEISIDLPPRRSIDR